MTLPHYNGDPPSGLSRCETRSGYSDTALIFIWITASCPANIKHLNRQLLCISHETVLWLRLKYKGWFRREGAPRNHYTINRLSYTPVAIYFAWLWCSPTASEGLSYVLNFTFSWESTPITLRWTSTDNYTLCVPHQLTPTLDVCPPFSISESAPGERSQLVKLQYTTHLWLRESPVSPKRSKYSS